MKILNLKIVWDQLKKSSTNLEILNLFSLNLALASKITKFFCKVLAITQLLTIKPWWSFVIGTPCISVTSCLVPRSMALDKAPVCRPRWNDKSSECKWRNTFRATVRIEFWATLPNTALRNSFIAAAPVLANPSASRTQINNKNT